MAGREKTLFGIYQKMDSKHLSFAQVTDMYGFRIIVPSVIDCYTGLGVLHQMYKPVPGKFKDHIAIAKANGYQSLHTTLVGPSGINIEFQLRTEEMHVVAEAGVAAHWLYKAPKSDGKSQDRMGTQWLQSLLDIQNETRDAAEFWDHVKVDLFPDAVYVFTPKSKIMALPRAPPPWTLRTRSTATLATARLQPRSTTRQFRCAPSCKTAMSCRSSRVIYPLPTLPGSVSCALGVLAPRSAIS